MRLDAVARICRILPDVSLPCVSPSAGDKFLDQAVAAFLALDSAPLSWATAWSGCWMMVATGLRILENRLLLQEVGGSGSFAWGVRIDTTWS